MRTTIVYILRLLVDETEPGALRGILRQVDSGCEHTFTSEEGLLHLLRQPGQPSPQATEQEPTTSSRRSDP
jgi:hypothetical protein